jgi:hypothetical protein
MSCRHMNCLQRKTPSRENSLRAPDLIVLPIDHAEVGFHRGRTRNDSCDATAKLRQLRKEHRYRAPAICEAHYAGLNVKLVTQAVSLWMAHLNPLNSLSRYVQSYSRPLKEENHEREEGLSLR